MKVLQICSAPRGIHYHNPKFHDNTHCVTIVNNLLFDPNKHFAIPLTKSNLDSCCVDDHNKCLFHHVSMTFEFVPGVHMKKNMKRKISFTFEKKKKRK